MDATRCSFVVIYLVLIVIQIVKVISVQQQIQIREALDFLQPYLTKDVSRYAFDRDRLWLEHEADLRKEAEGKIFYSAIKQERLWNWCTKIYEMAANKCQVKTTQCDLGLVAYGKNGITWHRDQTYANYFAVSINISTEPTLWGYQACRNSFGAGANNESAEKQVYEIPPGGIVAFNCKNPHAVIRCDDTRYSINLWNAKFGIQ